MSSRKLQPIPSGGPKIRSKPSTGNARGKERVQRKRVLTNRQACDSCRQVKVKCDGQRPRCSHCVEKDYDCAYAGEPGQSRFEALMSRLVVLEDFVKALQVENPDEAHRLLQGIRSGDDIRSLLPQEGSSSSERQQSAATAVHSSSSPDIRSPARHLSQLVSKPATTDSETSKSTRTSPDVSKPLINFANAGPEALKNGITAFFSCSGKLFHVFTEEQIAGYCNDLVRETSQDARKFAICCTAAVAATGTQYHHVASESGTMESFYEIAKHYFDGLLEANPLEATKVCTLLAMYNIFNKATVALAYVDIGLSLCRRFGIDLPFNSSEIPEKTWLDYRRSWRTLMFFSGWLASTLGYVSRSNTLYDKVRLSDSYIGQPTTLSDIVQNEMVKISLLKANIIHMQSTMGELSLLSLDSMMNDLESWYSNLPKVMYISSLALDGIASEARRSIYHVHLLYLGAIILLYRRIAYHLVRVNKSNESLPLLGRGDKLMRYFNDGNHAARHSSTILGLLLAENGIFKRCWLVIFQAYTTSIVLLFSVIQRRLHRIPDNEVEHDLEKTEKCLEVLAFCGTRDHVARKFHQNLLPFYDVVVSTEPQILAQRSMRPSNTPPDAFRPGLFKSISDDSSRSVSSASSNDSVAEYFSIPETGDPILRKHAFKLLEMLCQPFGNVEEIYDSVEEDLNVHMWNDPSRYEPAQMAERLIWQFESRRPFHWDFSKVGIQESRSANMFENAREAGGQKVSPNRFMGSMQPNGWSSIPGMMREDHFISR